ncbi:MAG: hypothetical protein K2Q21_13175 [Chitinophagaceae bacterium]|nr:hypothetical protein [Chitinophagaceae bacterium]
MNQTKTLFLENTYLFAMLANVLETGTDEYGNYFVVDRSIYYPQGGGQRSDDGYISLGKEHEIKIIKAKYTDNGMRHYTESIVPKEILHREVAMHIFQDSRRTNAAYHTAGHWLSQLIFENMQLPLFPVKGHHFPNEAYIEFEGNANCITPETIDEMRMVMQIDLQANPKMNVTLAKIGSKLFESALLPKNFKPPINKPLRFTRIEGYRWLPCGGTHLDSLREIKSVIPIEFYTKSGKLRLKYRCEMWGSIAS